MERARVDVKSYKPYEGASRLASLDQFCHSHSWVPGLIARAICDRYEAGLLDKPLCRIQTERERLTRQ